MGLEVLDADFTQVSVNDGINVETALVNDKDFGKINQDLGNQGLDVPIKFGSHGAEGPVKGEGDAVVDTNFPKDAVDEWPAPKQIHSFYFVKYRPYDDPKLKVKIDQVEKELQRKNQARFQILEALKAKKSERANVIAQVKPLNLEDRRYRAVVDDKKREIGPLHEALGKLRGANNSNREKGARIFSSEKELNDAIQSLHYQIQHESNTLVQEKLLLREIKTLEGTRDKVIAHVAMKAKIQEALGPKEAIEDQVQLIGLDLDGVKKEKQVIQGKIKVLNAEVEIINKEIVSLEEELQSVIEKRDMTYASLVELKKKRDEVNANFYQYRTLLNNAKVLAAKKDIAALEELSQTEGDKFIALWSSNKSVRDDYEKRILSSLDQRQLSRDGRMRNPDEKPLVTEALAPAPVEPEILSKNITKKTKEDSKLSASKGVAPVRKIQEEDAAKLTEKKEAEDKEKIITPERPQKEAPAITPADDAKLKEMKREEELAKAKMALERKKKLAEKAAAKAAIRAQKEAEKKLKDREKKAKKKAATSTPTNPDEQSSEADTEAVESKVVNVSVEAPVPKKEKENPIKYRGGRGKGQDSFPKVILKRKKSTPYWVWAAPVGALAFLFVVLGYYYLL